MSVISRYILREFVRMLAFCLLVMVFIFLLVDFFEKIDNFLDAGLPLSLAGFYFLMTIPGVILYVAPVAILVAVLISLGLLARSSEIVAFKACGVSLFRLSAPILGAALAMSALVFLLADNVIPWTSARVNHIWNVQVEGGEDARSSIHKNVWFRARDGVYHFKLYDEDKALWEGVSLYLFRDRFILEKRIEATRARMDGRIWVLENAKEKTYLAGGNIEVQKFKTLPMMLPAMPEEFSHVERSADEMSFSELNRWIDTIQESGYDTSRYRVDLQMKISFPFICVIMAVLGLPIAFWKEKGGGIALGIGVGVGVSFLYVVFLGLSRSLGVAGLLPPVMAAWLPNLTFTLLGFFLFSFIRQ